MRGVGELHLRAGRAEGVVGGVPAPGGLEDHGAVGAGDEAGHRLGRHVAFSEDLAGGVHEAVLGAHLVHVESQVVR